MFYLRKPNIKIDFKDYKDALFSSLRCEEWVHKAYTNESTMLEWFDTNNTVKAKKAINEYKKTKDLANLIRIKNQKCLSEQALDILFNAGKAKTNLRLAELIYEKTEYYANIAKYLLFEFCENTGQKIDAVIMPFPEDLDDTTKPLNKFKVCTQSDKIIKTTVGEKNLNILENNSSYQDLKKYFEDRLKTKKIKKRFLKLEQISESEYKKAIRELINLKEVEIPCKKCYLTSEDCAYKILYYGNQTVSDQINEQTLVKNNMKILSIAKIT